MTARTHKKRRKPVFTILLYDSLPFIGSLFDDFNPEKEFIKPLWANVHKKGNRFARVIKSSDINIQHVDFISRHRSARVLHPADFHIRKRLRKPRKRRPDRHVDLKYCHVSSNALCILGQSALRVNDSRVRMSETFVYLCFQAFPAANPPVTQYWFIVPVTKATPVWTAEIRNAVTHTLSVPVPQWLAGGGRRAQTAADGHLHTFTNIAAPAIVNTFVRAAV